MTVRAPRLLLAVAIVIALAGAGSALRGHPAAGVVFVALAVAIACTVLRHHLQKEPRR